MTAARSLLPRQTVRVDHGPQAGRIGVVASLVVCDQAGTNLTVAIVDFEDGGRSVRPADEHLTVLPAQS